MSAEATARKVLNWAANPDGAVPRGPLRPASPLAAADAETRAALGRLVHIASARLGAGSPPFGDAAPIGPGALLLAAAIGGAAHPGEARIVAAAVEPLRLTRGGFGLGRRSGGWTEAVARHAVVGPVCDWLSTPPSGTAQDLRALSETLLRASPLTAVLHRPSRAALASGTIEPDYRSALALLARPRGREVLCTALAGWSPDPAVLNWRAALLGRLKADHPDVVVETYLCARLCEGAVWDERLHTARRQLSRLTEPEDSALAAVRYWGPLDSLLRRSDTARLVRAHPLLSGFEGPESAIALVRTHRLGEETA